MLKPTNLKAGRWDELEARAYLQLVQWAAQRIRSIDREEYPLFVQMEERFNDGYLFNLSDQGQPHSILLEATFKAFAKAELQPEDLVNILAMVQHEKRLIPMMGSVAGVTDFDNVRLESQLGWLVPRQHKENV